MALAVANVANGGYISPRGLGFGSGFDGGGVVSGFRVRAETVPSMRVRIGGEYNASLLDDRGRPIELSDRAVIQSGVISYMVFTDDNQPVSTDVVTAHASLPTMCAVVLWVDTSVAGSTSVVDGSNGALKAALIPGTPDTSKPMPTHTQITAETGTQDYEIIASVDVPAGATTITNSMIRDLRFPITGVGKIEHFGGDAFLRPPRTLICDGSEVNIDDYSLLFRVIGHTYAFDTDNNPKTPSSGKFFLPDSRGRHITGLDARDSDFNTLGKSGGAKTHSHPLSDRGYAFISNPSSNIAIKRVFVGNWTPTHGMSGGSYTPPSPLSTGVELGGVTDSHSSLAPHLIANNIIRY